MNQEIQFRAETTTLVLAHSIHQDLPVKQRAQKFQFVCRNIRRKTKHQEMFAACNSVLRAVNKDGETKWQRVVNAIDAMVDKFWELERQGELTQALKKMPDLFDYEPEKMALMAAKCMQNKKLMKAKQFEYFILSEIKKAPK